MASKKRKAEMDDELARFEKELAGVDTVKSAAQLALSASASTSAQPVAAKPKTASSVAVSSSFSSSQSATTSSEPVQSSIFYQTAQAQAEARIAQYPGYMATQQQQQQQQFQPQTYAYGRPGQPAPGQSHQQPIPAPQGKAKKKTLPKPTRAAGGEAWYDPTLDEWDPNDFRIFVGDIGNEVSDDGLAKVFQKYTSFQKARVVRDRKTGKSKGYGFVSFKDPQDFLKALKEMNGKYVGNRPIKLRKSTWKDRDISSGGGKKLMKKKLKRK